jgi:hypothetical protein
LVVLQINFGPLQAESFTKPQPEPKGPLQPVALEGAQDRLGVG